MADTFNVEILTPKKKLLSEEVSEVVLPAYDGERGILANHEDFIGLLGTGPLKLLKDGNDYWCMVSSGVYEIKGGKLSIIAEVGEKAEEVNGIENMSAKKSELEEKLEKLSLDQGLGERKELAQIKARLEVHRRTELVN